jgi:tetratricopeptide (TPR) repeat protein
MMRPMGSTRLIAFHYGFGVFLIGAFLCLGSSLPVLAAQENGGVESPFELGLSARDLGLGGAVGAWTEDAGAAMDNPALLSTLQRQELDTFHASLFVDTLYDAVAYTYPDGHGALQGALMRIATTGIPLTTDSIQSEGTFSVQQIQGRLAYGLPLWRSFSIGAAVKYLRQSVPPNSDSGFGGDMGLLWKPSVQGKDRSRFSLRNLSLALSVSNLLQPEIRLRSDVSRFARVVKAAMGYRFVSSGGQSAFSLGVEMSRLDGVITPATGLEYGFHRLLFLRSGYDGVGACLGAGVQFKGFQFDWAMAKRDLGGSQRFSLCYRFGAVKDSRDLQRLAALKWIAHTFTDLKQYPEALKAWENVKDEFPEDAEAAKGPDDVVQKRDRDVVETLEGVRKLMAENQTAQAIPGLTHVLSLDPGNAQAKQFMRQADEKVFMAQNYMTGFECYNRGDYRGAVIAFEAVYRREPQYRDVARLWSDAKSHYEPLAGMSEELSRLYGQGVSEYLKGHYAQAIEIWKKVLVKSPNHFIVQRNIAEAQARIKDAQTSPTQVKP